MTTKRALKGNPATPVRKLAGVPYELQQVQTAIERATKKSRSDNHARGVKLRVVSTATGTKRLAHRLGRKPQAFDLIQLKGAVSYTIGVTNSRDFTIGLSGPGTLDFWIW